MIRQLPIVRDHMDTRVPTVRPDMEILEAVEFLLKHRVTGAPVVDDAGRLVGMLTEKDCLKLVATGVEANVARGTVESFMTTEVTTIPPDLDVYYVAGLFLNYEFRRLPVVEDDRLVGAITRFDILRVMRLNLY
jgi:CBS domain-containing protein